MAKLDPAIVAHLEWIGFVRPTGLVVSAPALVRAGAILDRRDAEGQHLLRGCVEERAFEPKEGPVPYLPDFCVFMESVLGWSFSPKGYAGTAESPITPELEVPLPDYGETLRPDFAVRELDPRDGASPWQLLVRILEPDDDFDRVVRGNGRLEASAHGRMERLLRQTGVPAGLLFNGRALRLLSAPRGESSGWLDFRVAEMVQTAGRPISTALRLLLSQARLLSLPRAQRLAALLEDSRKFQNEVSERLAEQVLHALYELLRGFQAAHDASKGELLRQPLAEHPDEVYRALLTVILRLVFLLYAEERDMLPEDETFLRFYSLAGLYERLREDAALFPDTIDQRFGAWAQLLVLFRMVHDGAESGEMQLPQRHGVLFDPERFLFLEGRFLGGAQQIHERIAPPLVPDGTIYRALEKLLVLDGERISYSALDVEQIGSVYETMMGFRLETATGRSVAIKAQKKRGAPTAVDLEALLLEPAAERDKWLQDRTDRKLTDTVKKAVAGAMMVEDLHAALLPVIDPAATPDLAPMGAMVLQPSEERRRSGSHYTPRSLTEPIVTTTLEPILVNLRGSEDRPPTPAQILDLKVCDPAMGSGAFLVEACRQLGDALVEAWHAHGEVPTIPPDEDEVVFARRMIAQRCLFGVDRNPVAVDLAKVSLWLVTLATDHALTFLDHALRHGDSLVGLSRKQIEAFHWVPGAPLFQAGFETMRVREHVAKFSGLRRRIREAEESVTDQELRNLWGAAQVELGKARLFGDLVLAAFFDGAKPKEREMKRAEYAGAVVRGDAERYRNFIEERRSGEQSLTPFHWEIEFPEVFDRDSPGFDAIVGNPPFLGGKQMPTHLGPAYCELIKGLFSDSKGAADLCAFFFRRGYDLLRVGGSFGLLATNTISETATRKVGLDVITKQGGDIYCAIGNMAWPGTSAVTVSRVHVLRGRFPGTRSLNGKSVDEIGSTLTRLVNISTAKKLFQSIKYSEGVKLYDGGAFIVEKGKVPALIHENTGLTAFLRVYVNGDVLNDTPHCTPLLYAIDFGEKEEREIHGCDAMFPDLKGHVSQARSKQTRQVHEHRPWLHWDKRIEFFREARRLDQIVATTIVSSQYAFHVVSPHNLYAHGIKLFADERVGLWGTLQSRVHEFWARAMTSTLGTSIRYTTSSCFDTFPFSSLVIEDKAVVDCSNAYLMTRSQFLEAAQIGTTELYRRFHDPDERDPEIAKLRELHAAMDRAVLDAYGWSDIPTDCNFLLDYEIDEEEWGNKKKPCRYRWPDEVRDEVLARLLELNAERAKEGARSGAGAAKMRGKKAESKDKKKAQETRDFFS